MAPATMITRAVACRVLGIRVSAWPRDLPVPTGVQLVLLRALRKRRDAFVAAADPETGILRVIVLSPRADLDASAAPRAREYALLPDGRLRRARAGIPYNHREDHHAA